MTFQIVEGVDEGRIDARKCPLLEGTPPIVERYLEQTGAQLFDSLHLVQRAHLRAISQYKEFPARGRTRRHPGPCCPRMPSSHTRCSSAALMCAITLAAPRILNDPMGCRLSIFRKNSRRIVDVQSN